MKAYTCSKGADGSSQEISGVWGLSHTADLASVNKRDHS